MFVGALLAAFMPNGPYPITVITGMQGTGKSRCARVLRMLLDPSVAPLRSFPSSARHLYVSAANERILAYDNIPQISKALSDNLCRISTGGGTSETKLHTNQEQVLNEATKPIILNGISISGLRQDLLDRAFLIETQPIPSSQFHGETEFEEAFERILPRAFGALALAVSTALANQRLIDIPDRMRMIDADRFIATASPAFGWHERKFIDAYVRNRHNVIAESLEDDPVAITIRCLVQEQPHWEGTATELLSALASLSRRSSFFERRFPGSPNTLGKHLVTCRPGAENNRY